MSHLWFVLEANKKVVNASLNSSHVGILFVIYLSMMYYGPSFVINIINEGQSLYINSDFTNLNIRNAEQNIEILNINHLFIPVAKLMFYFYFKFNSFFLYIL